MKEMKTVVYVDLEATGLKSSGKPRKSELSLVAVNIPRVLDKLTLCVYPMATIVPYVSSITGLDNYNLSEHNRPDLTRKQ